MPSRDNCENGFGMKVAHISLLDRHLLDHRAERHDVVGRREGVGVAQVDLVLAGARLVVAEFHRDPEVLEHAHAAAAESCAVPPGTLSK